jgi:hypothetical protein
MLDFYILLIPVYRYSMLQLPSTRILYQQSALHRLAYTSPLIDLIFLPSHALHSLFEVGNLVCARMLPSPFDGSLLVDSKIPPCLPPISAFGGPVPYTFFFTQFVQITQPFRRQDMPEARCA